MKVRDVIREAIIAKRSVTAQSVQGVRRFSPHAMGRELDGTEVVVGYQYAGRRADGLTTASDWSILRLDELQDVRLNDHEWKRGMGDPPRDHLVSIDVWRF